MEITKEQIEQYKNEKLQFQNYFKYAFTYQNEKIRITTNGISDEMYRSWMVQEMTLEQIIEETSKELYITII